MSGQHLFQDVVAVALRVVRNFRDDFVTEPLIERSASRRDRRQEDTVASPAAPLGSETILRSVMIWLLSVP